MVMGSIPTLKTPRDAILHLSESTTVRTIFGSRIIYQWIRTTVVSMIEQSILTIPTPKMILLTIFYQRILIMTVYPMLSKTSQVLIGEIQIRMEGECSMARSVLNNSGCSIASVLRLTSLTPEMTFLKTMSFSGRTTQQVWSILVMKNTGGHTLTIFQQEVRLHTMTQFTHYPK